RRHCADKQHPHRDCAFRRSHRTDQSVQCGGLFNRARKLHDSVSLEMTHDSKMRDNMKLNIATGRATALLTGLVLMSFFGTAKAALVEGFESGFASGESVTGDAGIRTSYFSINAPEGTHHLLLT